MAWQTDAGDLHPVVHAAGRSAAFVRSPYRWRATGYRRSLSLDTAIATTSFPDDGALITHKVFASRRPIRPSLSASPAHHPGQINLRIGLASKLHHTVDAAGDNALLLSGRAPSHVEPSYRTAAEPVLYSDDPAQMGMSFALHVRALVEGGSVIAEESELHVRNADTVVLVVTRRHELRRFRPVAGIGRCRCARARSTDADGSGCPPLHDSHRGSHC